MRAVQCFVLISTALIQVGVPPALSSTRGQTPPDATTKTFIPHAGYVGNNRVRELERRNAEATLAPPPEALKGARKLPVICVEFSQLKHAFPEEDYAHLLFDSATPPGARKTLTKYYWDMSLGRWKVDGDVFGWFTLPKDYAYYGNKSYGFSSEGYGSSKFTGRPFGEFLQQALQKANQVIPDWGAYDNDGPDGKPNSGDDDGIIDTLVIIQAGIGGEQETDTANHLWSRSDHYSYYHPKPFVTKTLRKGHSAKEGESAYIKVEDFILQPALRHENPSDEQKDMITIGVFCHEYGHALGLPDLYDRTPRPTADSRGIGNYCLMSTGCYGGDGEHSETPTAMCPWSKQRLGWANVQTVASNGVIDFEEVEKRNKVIRINVPKTDNLEYFLIENRDSVWADSSGGGKVNWDVDLPGSGLAIWHVDDRVGRKYSLNWPFAPLDHGQNDSPSVPNKSNKGFAANHALVSLVQADHQLALENNGESAAASYLWHSNQTFGDDSKFTAGSRSYQRDKTGIMISNIDTDEGTMLVQAEETTAPSSNNFAMMTPPPMAANKEDNGQIDADDNGKVEVKVQNNLSIPAQSNSLEKDAQKQVTTTLKDVVGDAKLVLKKSSSEAEQPPTLQQVVKVNSEPLPVFGNETKLFYSSGENPVLLRVESKTVDKADLVVTGKPGQLNLMDAKKLVIDRLKINASLVMDQTEGVYLVDDDPKNAHVVVQIRLLGGEKQPDIHVYVDEETRQILAIRRTTTE